MKKKISTFLAVLFSLIFSASVWADGGRGQDTDYHTDYYMIVESKNGGINIYAETDPESGKLNNKPIPNGTALHIRGEKKDASGKEWGLTEYHGMNGFVQFDELKPAALAEAVKSELGSMPSEDTDYNTVIAAEAGSVKLYRGPGEKFGEAFAEAVKNGESVHISMEAKAEDGSLWGKVTGGEKEGWINLKEAGEKPGTGKGSEKATDKKNIAAPTAEITPSPTVTPAAEEADAPAAAAATQNVDGVSVLFMNPVLWIVAAAILIVLVFLYFLKLK